MALVECVINVSEGRESSKIAAMRRACEGRSGCYVLDVHSDWDHHRTVFTLAGDPMAVLETALALSEEAVRSTDMNRHHGVHPRIGAVDVVPFIPLQGCDVRDCVDLAHQFGEAFSRHCGVPVFLYGQAAQQADRIELSSIRRGQYEGLKVSGTLSGTRVPDYGPLRPHATAGATAVGARDVLIAFNVCLDSGDAFVACSVARRVRESGGGLPGVRAIGLYLERKGHAQVSVNLVDYRQSTPLRVFETVKREVEGLEGVVLGTEIVGLVPRAALPADFTSALELIPAGSGASTPILEDRILHLMGIEVSL